MILLRKTAKAILLGMLMIFLVVGGCAKDTSEVVAEVNGIKLTREQLKPRVDQIKHTFEMQGFVFDGEEGAEMLALFEQEALKQLITETVMKEEAKKQNISITPAEIQEHYDQFVEVYGEDVFKEILKQQEVTEQELKEEIEMALLQQKLYDKVTAGVNITDGEIEEYYQANRDDLTQYRASHILIMPDEEAEDQEKAEQEAKTKAESLIAELNQGADFAQLAKENSADGSAAAGGDLGDYFTEEDSPYVPEFTEAAISLNVGEYSSQPVESFFGYHIIKLTEKKETMEELREHIKIILENEAKNELFEEFSAQVMAEAQIINYLAEAKPQDGEDDEEEPAPAQNEND